MIPECDRAYIAGLFDGEGCVSYKQYNRKRAHNKSISNVADKTRDCND